MQHEAFSLLIGWGKILVRLAASGENGILGFCNKKIRELKSIQCRNTEKARSVNKSVKVEISSHFQVQDVKDKASECDRRPHVSQISCVCTSTALNPFCSMSILPGEVSLNHSATSCSKQRRRNFGSPTPIPASVPLRTHFS